MSEKKIVFFDTEVDPNREKILDMGAVKEDGREFHSASLPAFVNFLHGSEYLCGHNIINHDLKYLAKEITVVGAKYYIDTLYLSPLLFPKKPYHPLVKDEKLLTNELNNPLNDAKKARDLFYDEVAAIKNLDVNLAQIYSGLLADSAEFKGFFHYAGFEKPAQNIAGLIKETFSGKICANAPLQKIAEKYPVELAYALSQINVIKYDSVTPPWVLKNYPRVENILQFLRSRNCRSCVYCNEALDETKALKKLFQYDGFRIFDRVPLQQDAVKASVDNESILVIFPTGGGKSITFQLPALMAGVNEKGLTVVISPLQSLMKDQTDNLEKEHSITKAVTINASLDPLERAKAFERVEDGSASLLYISPESLRSKSIERLLIKRNVVRFVIDEAHCFSAWGQDFRPDYLYIGSFISSLQEKKGKLQNIPVSCFTATAKQQVIADIKNYFQNKLSLELKVFRANAARANLTYHIFNEESSNEKYMKLRSLIEGSDCPVIVYVSSTRLTEELAKKLTGDGYPAKPYHGQMDKQIRVINQDAFMRGDVKIIVATTAFGMGVDKKDVGMVIHYDISDSLENYVQEAGRAGRSEEINADCYILFNEDDLNNHFSRLNQIKLSQKEIQQIWKTLKDLFKNHAHISQSALEIARKSGWDDSVRDIETRVRSAINALEQANFVKRGQNMPRLFADGIRVKNMSEAREKIDNSPRFDTTSREQAIRIINSLISAKSKARGQSEEGEDRVDYIADRLGINIKDVIKVINLLREENILGDSKDLVAYIKTGEKTKKSKDILSVFISIEKFLASYLDEAEKTYNLKEVNEHLHSKVAASSINQLKMILNYFEITHFIKKIKEERKNYITIKPVIPLAELKIKSEKRHIAANDIIEYLYSKVTECTKPQNEEDTIVSFSVFELKEKLNNNLLDSKTSIKEIEDALYYLLKIGAMRIEGGFLVIYNKMYIERLENDNKTLYKKEDYAQLEEYYQNKRQQIHIVGEYAKYMIDDYRKAMDFVNDYFVMDYDLFLQKYFRGRKKEISRNISPQKFEVLFGELSPSQLSIVNDHESKCIVVAAGPGSGKTKLLTHKLASLFLMEDVKHEQMLMLTFSRAAATEFKKRLISLIGNAAHFIQIMTFHAYCFDLLGKVGDLEKSDKIISQTIEKIKSGEVDLSKLTKTVLVIDEAQDMSDAEFDLVKTLMDENEDLRIIAVGDDDQNIYEFRGSSSVHLKELLNKPDSKKYELLENYRSAANIVEFANSFAQTISQRLKTMPVMPKQKENGTINVCKLISNKIAIPIVNAVLDIKPLGSTCVAVRTNEEALNVTALLLQNGINARIIQANNGFNLLNLAEIRDFIVDIEGENNTHAINDEVWQNAKQNLARKYEGSSNLSAVFKLINDFEETNNKTKYKSDFRQFVNESKLEDFMSSAENTVLVSTIHQTKGMEFDNVFLALSRFQKIENAAKREIYVAITRAKKNLYVYYCGEYFDKIYADNVYRTTDKNEYPAPAKITLSLSHKDVKLGYFDCRQREIDNLKSGQELLIRDAGCFAGDKQVLKFSSNFNTQIETLKVKGYYPDKASVRHIVFWYNEEKNVELKIILANIEFCKK